MCIINKMYKFSLGTVLNHRKILEENLQKELGLLNQALANQKNEYEELETRKNTVSEDHNQKKASFITVSESLMHMRFLERLAQQQDQHVILINKLEIQINQKREELIQAMKNRKVLEKLKEKGSHRYQEEERRTEADFMNEMAAIRYHTEKE